ncbi:hypothetical protein [uncultured Roseivirga sp.]|uniref:hypothetical protein n=1 Tax=uncultured Roseivirga sp. TaxID=543088 RepID=UPI0030DCF1D7|tara:strand:+ start:17980 stop:18570 length:591 start_codon:yes stop_codon:yes gene_type:complete
MINAGQTQQIRSYLLQQGFTNTELIDDLVDHLSCEVELLIEHGRIDFTSAFSTAKEKVMPDYAIQIENDLKFLTTKKYNTMIKKLAFIGGYASAVCLCLSILFFSQSLLGSKRSQLKVEAMQVEHYLLNQNEDEVNRKKLSEITNQFYRENLVASSEKFEYAETFLIISFALFAALYLPYQFYSKYQRSDQSLQQA